MQILKIKKGFSKIAKKTGNFFLDVLFPVKCLGCGKESIWLCGDCLEKIPPLAEQLCPWCEKIPTPGGRVCFACRNISPLDGLVVASSYRDTVMAKIIHCFKYNFVGKLSRPLGQIMIRAYLDSRLPIPELIIPVPLHKRRLRWRGFNQASLLSRCLASGIAPGYAIPFSEGMLIRKKFTRPQMKISNYISRKNNIREAFGMAKSTVLSGKNTNFISGKVVLLVDDVATTGATLFECARVLKENGAKEVFGIVAARQEMKKK